MLSVVAVPVLALLGLPAAEVSDGAVSCRLRVHVAAAGLTAEQLALARLQVTRIWRPYGVAIEWPSEPPGPRPSGPGVLRVWLARDGIPGQRPVPSGWIAFDRAAHPDDRIVVTAAAERLLDTTRFDGVKVADAPRSIQDHFIAVALGRMLAHEVGHYVLASRSHARRGLLGPRFAPSGFLSEDLSRYRLDSAERERLSSFAPTVCLPPEGPPPATVASRPEPPASADAARVQ